MAPFLQKQIQAIILIFMVQMLFFFLQQPENVANQFESCRTYQIIVFCIYRFKKK